ncbi:PBECR3 domain-containing polyvalent protein [Helicobacter ailurogastricus]|uniref:PBECR3 domain-containing polyvalent protein n=1 Tax=Helicobacter ailurogastricus TaxID=1578720 RepID=UPI0022BD6547|nr:hypothetical protein [Helicobacter ailurogastricus]GLH58073.1 hypothetical protein NHP214376_08620 [Helicobacter ailurogastricus]GLH59316.1 hypothetical protein NHP214377_05830 [Helicobacter ailurogastricus]
MEQIGAKERPYEVITDKEAFIQDLDLSVNATPIPASLDVEGFLKSLEGVKHENFMKHLQDKGNATERLAYLNLVEPTLKTPDIELFFKDPEKKEYIKAFKKENGKDLTYLLVTADGDRLLLTGLPVRQKSYIERQIRDADIIHSFIQPGRLDTQGGLTPSGLPTKDSTTSPLLTDLSPQEIQEAVKKWDLASPKETDVLDFALVKDPELTELQEVFNTDKLIRQIRSAEVKDTLDKGFSLEEVLDYTSHLPTAQRNILGDELHYTKPLENGKTLNIVETYKAPKTLRFSRMDVIDDGVPPPKGDIEGTNPKGNEPQNPSTDTTKGEGEGDTSHKGNIEDTGTDFKAIAHELYTKAQEQESGFKELLGTLKQANNRIEGGNTLKTLESLEEKLAYYKGDTDKVNDSLRGAVVTDKEGFNEEFMQVLESLENNPSVSHISPKFIKTQDGYTGAHINFNFNGVPSEIQLHTPKSWEIKKQLDPLYKAKRRLQLERKLTNKDLRDFKRKMKALGQESDLDISLLTSFKLTSPQASSAMSVLSKKSGTELNENQDHLLGSNSNPGTSDSGNAYSRLESKLNQNDTSLTGGKGIEDTDIQTPSSKDTTTPLKGKSRLQQALEAQQRELEAKEAQLKAKALEDKENAAKWQAKLAQITQEKQALAGLKDNDRLLQVGASVPMQRLEVKSSVSLDDDHIYPLDYAIVKAKDIKPNFTSNTGTQMRMQTDRARVEQIANAFDPQKVFLRGGFDDLPIVLQDGQVLAGNHRAQGMLEFSPQSRAKYAQAVLEHYKVQLKPDELLVRVVANALNSKELLNLAMASNIERASTQGDKFLSALGKYDAQITPENLKHLDLKASSVEDMALRVAKFLDQQAKSPDIEKTNLALLGYSARNNADFGLSRVLDHAQNILSTEDFMAFKNAFIHNAGTFYNLLNNPHFPKLNLGPHLTRAMDATAKELAKDTRAENLKELIGNIEHLLSVTDPSLKATLKMNPTLFEDTLAQVLGVGFARFMRLENPDKHLFEFLQNVPKALQQELSETLFDKLNGIVKKPLEEANVYDFAKLLLKSGQITQDISKVANDLLDPLEARAKAFKSPILTEPKETMQIVNEAKREGKSIKETRELLEENKDHIAGLLPYKKDNTDALMKAGKEAHLNGAQMLTSLYMLDALKAKEVQARMLFKRAFAESALTYTPHFSPKVQEALQGRHIDITPQSFSQLELKSAKELSPWLKPTLEEPNALVKQNDGALIFVKDFRGFKLKAQIDNNNFLSLYRVQTFNKVPHTQEVLFSDLPELGVRPRRGVKPLKDNAGSGGDSIRLELISKETPAIMANKEDIKPAFLEEVKKRKNEKVWVGELTNPQIIEQLGFKTDRPIKMLLDGDALKHIEEKHGVDSKLAKNGQPPITSADIAAYPDMVNSADLMKVEDTSVGKRLVLGKQINGYAIVVEAIGLKRNALQLKTIYKENGKLENGLDFRDGAGMRLSKEDR